LHSSRPRVLRTVGIKIMIINISLHSHVFAFGFLLKKSFTKISGYMKVHTFQKNPKRRGHMKAHSIILKFAPSGMCETNIYRENLIRT
jgi:hypothetical protein